MLIKMRCVLQRLEIDIRFTAKMVDPNTESCGVRISIDAVLATVSTILGRASLHF